MSQKGRILIVSEDKGLPKPLQQALEQLKLESWVCPPAEALDRIRDRKNIDAAVLALDHLKQLQDDDVKQCVQELGKLAVGLLVCAAETAGADAARKEIGDGIVCVSRGESPEMIKGRLATLLEMRPHLRQLQGELQRLNVVAAPLNNYFTQVDEEMRLAARLQRDFLPRELPQLPEVRFATIYRPATWVSGDIYDIMRLDEEHVGFYVADAVGHGMPAALLTMFIKRALVTKRIEANSYHLIDPGAALAQLNADMVGQELSNFQFATCCYAILHTKTLRLRIANAGHPPPMLISQQASPSELEVSGSLLGVFPDQTYETQVVQLHQGDKLLLFSDGVEVAFVDAGPDEPLRFRQEFGDLAHCDIQTMCAKLVEIIDREEGSLHPRDDVTIIGLELTSETAV